MENLVNNFSVQTLTEFLEEKFKDFEYSTYEEDITDTISDNFTNEFPEVLEIFEVKLEDENKLKAYAIKVSKDLSERSSKKRQFDLAKKILSSELGLDGGFFVFYDYNGNFRFSLIHKVYKKGKTDFSHYKRYTYFVEKGKPYRTFLNALLKGDFSTLDNIIKSFSTQPLTEEFFTEIQNWYAWALKHAKFPGGILEENLIRLLTRLIFVWFLKEKKLIPDSIFDEEFLGKVVKDFGKGDYYYNVILQNLFFATLNKYPNERGFANHGNFVQNKNDFGVKTLYRYKDKILISEEEFLDIFKDVPFVNGGLFECLDEDKEYIDGFSRNENKRSKIPDFLFFSDKREEDLGEFYGEKKKIVEVRGLINILKDYNFTADESTPIDIEVSLDPELLGHIFENLLASYNPETQTTARRATGSYYTPKEIVDFMVEQSLFEYLKTKTNIDEDKLKKIISYEEDSLDLSEEEKKQLIDAIDSLKIIDPAVGSGAFPMGILHKLVYILSKIDTDNNLWYELQYQKALNESGKILKKENKQEREEQLKELNDNFDEATKYPDYARKLYIIENSIYGVDIQNIAIQISKLRFFLSLIIDQKVDKNQDNFGIKPLPHLETKFVCANTLIGLEKPAQKQITSQTIKNLEDELKEIYKRFFRVRTRSEKKRLEEKGKDIRQKLKDELKKFGYSTDAVEKIANFNIFSQTEKADWFDPEWMFGVEDGFDIVIGNPPYGNIMSKKQKEFINKHYMYSTTSDISSPFVERGCEILNDEGILTYVITFAITFNKDFSKIRQLLRNLFRKVLILSFDRDKCRFFENMSQSISILLAYNKNSKEQEGIFTSRMFRETPNIYQIEVSNADKYLLPIGTSYSYPHRLPKLGERINVIILEKILKQKRKSKDILNGNSAIWIRTSGNYWYNAWDKCPYESSEIRKLYVDNLYKDFLIVLMNSSLFYFWFRIFGDGRHMNLDIFEEFPIPTPEEIKKFEPLLNKASHSFLVDLWSVFDSQRKRFLTSNIKDKIDLLDLILGRYLYKLNHEEILHIMNYDKEVRGGIKLKQYETLASQILTLTQDPTYDTDPQKQAKVKEIEKQIDQLVYKLYNLTEEEIGIIEGGKNGKS